MNRLKCIYIILWAVLFLGVYEGRIALWDDQNSKPTQVFPYYASMLPKDDQSALEKGIRITDQRHLHRLLEDYLS